MHKILNKFEDNLDKNLKDFEEIYRIAIDTGQLNIALKAKELIMKNTANNESRDLKNFFEALSYFEVEELADIVRAERKAVDNDLMSNFGVGLFVENTALCNFKESIKNPGNPACEGDFAISQEMAKHQGKPKFREDSSADFIAMTDFIKNADISNFSHSNYKQDTNPGNPAHRAILQKDLELIKRRNFAAFDEILRRYLLKRRAICGVVADYNDFSLNTELASNPGNPACEEVSGISQERAKHQGNPEFREDSSQDFITVNDFIKNADINNVSYSNTKLASNPGNSAGEAILAKSIPYEKLKFSAALYGLEDLSCEKFPKQLSHYMTLQENFDSKKPTKTRISSTWMGVAYVREVCDRILQTSFLKQKKYVEDTT